MTLLQAVISCIPAEDENDIKIASIGDLIDSLQERAAAARCSFASGLFHDALYALRQRTHHHPVVLHDFQMQFVPIHGRKVGCEIPAVRTCISNSEDADRVTPILHLGKKRVVSIGQLLLCFKLRVAACRALVAPSRILEREPP